MRKVDFKQANLNTILRHKGPFNLVNILRFFKKWTEDRHYTFNERQYNKKPDKIGTRYKIKLEADKKVNAYVRWYIIIKILGYDIEEREVVKNGVKEKQDYGRIKFEFWGKTEVDYNKDWETTPFYQKLQNIFHEHIIDWDNETLVDDVVYYEVYKLKEALAEQLDYYYIG